MRTMTWEQIDKDWGGLQKKHRMEIAEAITRYCIGHKLDEVAKRLGYSVDWIRKNLDYSGIGIATGGSKLSTPLGVSGEKGVDHAVSKLVSKFKPNAEVVLEDDGDGNQTVATINGKDAEDFEPYLEHYLEEGHKPAAATRLAKAEWAGEAAAEAGVIKESTNKRDEKVHQILFPEDKKSQFELQLRSHMANVKRAARFLDDANMAFVKKAATAKEVLSADVMWSDQVDRIRNLQPTSKKGN